MEEREKREEIGKAVPTPSEEEQESGRVCL